MSIIKDLFNGQVYPFEALSCTRESINEEKRLNEYLKKADECCEKSEEEPISDKIRCHISNLENLSAEQSFELGFSIGMRFAVEAMLLKP